MKDKVVMTLDAGGTNFVFSAMQNEKEIVDTISLPSNAHDLKSCIATLIDGFNQIANKLTTSPAAISFAFPGPADYPNGIIGNLPNFKAFRNGVPLKAILQQAFSIPVFINNDGNLFAYGEALAGALPAINKLLEEAGNSKRYKNLIGFTLGTGFGGGITLNRELLIGDSSNAAEVFLLRSRTNPEYYAEEGVSIRAIQRVYASHSGDHQSTLEPFDIYQIAQGVKDGNKEAACAAFAEYGTNLGDAVGQVLTLIDGLVVIGGGIAKARKYIMPSLMQSLTTPYQSAAGEMMQRPIQKMYDLSDAIQLQDFLKNESVNISYEGTPVQKYIASPKSGIAFSKDASKSIALGAYHFALKHLD